MAEPLRGWRARASGHAADLCGSVMVEDSSLPGGIFFRKKPIAKWCCFASSCKKNKQRKFEKPNQGYTTVHTAPLWLSLLCGSGAPPLLLASARWWCLWWCSASALQYPTPRLRLLSLHAVRFLALSWFLFFIFFYLNSIVKLEWDWMLILEQRLYVIFGWNWMVIMDEIGIEIGC